MMPGATAATAATDSRERRWPAALVVLATALGYFGAGWAALALAGPPGYAAPLYPPAGIALAAALTFGRPAWLGAWIGAFAVNATLGWVRGQSGLSLWLLPLVIGFGAALQVAAGTILVRRFVSQPLVLTEPRDIARAGLLGAALACTLSPTVATLALAWAGAVAPGERLANWITWWAGDTLGVLIAAPLVLAAIGRPAEAWRMRRRTLALPLLAALALLAAAMWAVGRAEQEQARLAFEREADRLAASAQLRLQVPTHALQALHAAVRASGRPDGPTLRAASTWWLSQASTLQAMGYGERVAAEAVPALEAAARAEGLAAFRVRQRDEGRALAADGEAVVVRRIEPATGNEAALGINALSIPAPRAAIQTTRASGRMAATASFALTQSPQGETGIVLYQAIFDEAVARPAGAPRHFLGVLFVTLRTSLLLGDLASGGPERLTWCVYDPQPDATHRLLAGSSGCAGSAARVGLATTRPLMLADRPLALELRTAVPQPGGGPSTPWLLTVAGLSAAAALGAWLLSVTGHALRTQRAVETATGELRREVAERRQAEEERRASEARLRSIVDNVPLGVAFLDPHGKLLEANPRLFDMLGYPEAELKGRTVAELSTPEGLAALEREHRELLAGTRSVVQRALQLRRGDGEDLNVRIAASALRDESGRVVRMVAVVEDITEHLRLEAAERAIQKAEAANRAKSEFVSRMSHELRTPLNAMIGFAQLLGLDRKPALPEHQRQWAQQIQRAGWHLLELINETLDLARIESGAVELQLQSVDLPSLLAGALDMVSAAGQARRIRFEQEIDDGLPAVVGDPTRLKQVLTNLLTNAIKYNREGGRVVIRARADAAGRVGVSVTDTGLGMTPSQMQSLFQPYNRLGREGSGVEGTGIGLVISRRLAEMMSGTLEAQSRAGVGSTFTLRLPAAASPAVTTMRSLETAPAPYRQRQVLYIEDNETNVEVMRGMLLQRPQVHLEVSTLGLDGLAAARRLRPDLILLDMQLPDISGLELLRHLKADDVVAPIPVIVVSADATPARIEQALTLGAVSYVTKPVEVVAFLSTLDEVLDGLETRFGDTRYGM